MMKTIAMLVLLAGCFGGQGSGGGTGQTNFPACPTMIMTGQSCTTEPACEWSEGVDSGVPARHRCQCQSFKWNCTVIDVPEDDELRDASVVVIEASVGSGAP